MGSRLLERPGSKMLSSPHTGIESQEKQKVALSGINDCPWYSNNHEPALMLLSDSIAGTLFTIHEADQIDSNCDKASRSRLERRRAPRDSLTLALIPARCSSRSLFSPPGGNDVASR